LAAVQFDHTGQELGPGQNLPDGIAGHAFGYRPLLNAGEALVESVRFLRWLGGLIGIGNGNR
jgi:hypothetical protein